MRWKVVLHIIGALTLCVGLTMFFPLIFSLYYQDDGIMPLVKSLVVTAVCGLAMFLFLKGKMRIEVLVIGKVWLLLLWAGCRLVSLEVYLSILATFLLVLLIVFLNPFQDSLPLALR